MNIGDKVMPKTAAGLWLADQPRNSDYKQERKSLCVFRGVGTIVDVVDCVIDYDQWPATYDDGEARYANIGKVDYRSCFVRFEDGEGWAGAGALIPADQVMPGLPNNLPTFTQAEIDTIILQNRIHAWLVNTSEWGASWQISTYGTGFELSFLRRGSYEFVGKFYWNLTWIAVPFDGEAAGFSTAEEARQYIEKFAKED
jgi:hypothetical protein